MAQMKLIPADNMKDKLWGKRGTPEREAMEAKLKEDVNAYIVGEAIRKARLAQNLTQENSLVSVSGCSVLRFQSWRKVQVLSHYQP